MNIPPIRIPKERIGVLIGPDGTTRQEIEERSGTELDIDSETGEVRIHDDEAYDPVLVLKLQDVVKAIARGFSPERAFRLWQDDVYLELIDLTEYVGTRKGQIDRVKGRIIGSGGRTRETIEALSDAQVSIYGKTVGIIGEVEEVQAAHEAVDMLIDGAPHSTVYKFLEQARREMRMHDLGLG